MVSGEEGGATFITVSVILAKNKRTHNKNWSISDYEMHASKQISAITLIKKTDLLL